MKRLICILVMMAVCLTGCARSNGKTRQISCLSMNVLAYNTGGQENAPPEERLPAMIERIRSLDADIVGVQEAVEDYTYKSSCDLAFGLTDGLKDLYDSRWLTEEEDSAFTMMEISAGLIIFYKKDRFELRDSGCHEYFDDANRYFQWVKLYDKSVKKEVYVTNTHWSIDNNHGAESRVGEGEELAEFWENTVGDAPLFATGDYNCYVYDDAQLRLQQGIYQPSCEAENLPDSTSTIDFCYYNTACMRVTDYRYLSHEYDNGAGQTVTFSDHHPVFTVAEYK